jgi:hypothetical protein
MWRAQRSVSIAVSGDSLQRDRNALLGSYRKHFSRLIDATGWLITALHSPV